jgi:hypothetical protein
MGRAPGSCTTPRDVRSLATAAHDPACLAKRSAVTYNGSDVSCVPLQAAMYLDERFSVTNRRIMGLL